MFSTLSPIPWKQFKTASDFCQLSCIINSCLYVSGVSFCVLSPGICCTAYLFSSRMVQVLKQSSWPGELDSIVAETNKQKLRDVNSETKKIWIVRSNWTQRLHLTVLRKKPELWGKKLQLFIHSFIHSVSKTSFHIKLSVQVTSWTIYCSLTDPQTNKSCRSITVCYWSFTWESYCRSQLIFILLLVCAE